MKLTPFLRIAAGLATALDRSHERSIDSRSDLYSLGVTLYAIHKTIDVIIATACMEWNFELLHNDRDFLPLQQPILEPNCIDDLGAHTAIISQPAVSATRFRDEMLTGAYPFAASAPLEWVHGHIARQPAPPADQRKVRPRALTIETCLLMKARKTAPVLFGSLQPIENSSEVSAFALTC